MSTITDYATEPLAAEELRPLTASEIDFVAGEIGLNPAGNYFASRNIWHPAGLTPTQAAMWQAILIGIKSELPIT